MSNYLLVDETKWGRALHCNIFKNFSNPLYGVTVELDVTKFINKIRKLETSFTFAMIFVTARCANEIEAFRYRFLDGRVVLYDQINTVFTYLDKETELFKVVDVPLTDTLQTYVLAAQQAALLLSPFFWFWSFCRSLFRQRWRRRSPGDHRDEGISAPGSGSHGERQGPGHQ